MTRPPATLLLLVAIIGSLLKCAQGHGYLAIPKSRNFLHNSNYCPHCLNGGDPNAKKIGVCGDPADGPFEHEAGGKYARGTITGKYKAGGYIHVALAISTYHGGVLQYRICKYRSGSDKDEREAVNEECFQKNVLRQARIKGVRSKGSRFQYLGKAGEQGFNPPKLFHGTFKLPKGLTCDGKEYKCVLQMKWITGNRCNVGSIPSKYKRRELQPCAGSNQNPEQFANCADIRITADGKKMGYPYQSNWPAATNPLQS